MPGRGSRQHRARGRHASHPNFHLLRESRERFCSYLNIDLALPPLFLLAKHPFPFTTLHRPHFSLPAAYFAFHLTPNSPTISPVQPYTFPPPSSPPHLLAPPPPHLPFSTNPFSPHPHHPRPQIQSPTPSLAVLPPPMTPCPHYPATARPPFFLDPAAAILHRHHGEWDYEMEAKLVQQMGILKGRTEMLARTEGSSLSW